VGFPPYPPSGSHELPPGYDLWIYGRDGEPGGEEDDGDVTGWKSR
jgi:hypothetical protein